MSTISILLIIRCFHYDISHLIGGSSSPFFWQQSNVTQSTQSLANPRLTIPSSLTVIDRCICQLVPYPQGVGLVSFSLKGAYVNAAFKMPTSRWLCCIPSFLVLEKSRGTNDVG